MGCKVHPMDVIAKARAQLSALQGKIAEFQSKQQRLREFIATFEELRGIPDDDGDSVAEGPSVIVQMERLSRGQKPAKSIIADAVGATLRDGIPKHTRALLEMLDAVGIEVGGKDKVLSLSAILSSDDRFQASRKVGWSLKKAEPVSASTETGSFFNSGVEPDPRP